MSYEENYNDALILKDWFLFRDENFLYKGKVRVNIGKWKDERKKRLLILLKDFFDLTMSVAGPKMEKYYIDLLPGLMDKSYILIKHNEISAVFVKNKSNLIVKAYPTAIKNVRNSRLTEDMISKKLYKKGFNVPKRFKTYETDFYTCFPMEKLPLTLTQKLEQEGKGNLDLVCNIVKTVIPILEFLHKKLKRLYVDFSVGNIALKNDIVYMLDFGATHELNFSIPSNAKTIRYCSINAFNEDLINEQDDLQSLGFVLLEAFYGFKKSPLNGVVSEQSKVKVIGNAKKGNYGDFFQRYFHIVCGNYDSDNYQYILELCD
jgi:hypothetical protein